MDSGLRLLRVKRTRAQGLAYVLGFWYMEFGGWGNLWIRFRNLVSGLGFRLQRFRVRG